MWTIYHNPRCSKSCKALELLKERNIEVQIIEYLNSPLSEVELNRLAELLEVHPKLMLRTKEQVFKELELDTENAAAITQAIAAHPVLLERPIVLHQNKGVIARPPERVEELM